MKPLPLLFAVAVLAYALPVMAWGDLGHRIICEIAFREIDDGPREQVKAMIRRDSEFRLFADACTWPDHPRRRAVEHYVNLPRSARGLGENPCPLADECLMTAIEKDLAVLSSANASDEERLDALKYLGHWVGDVHQPMHVSFEDDRGGNDVDVSGICRRNLHAAWDSCLVEEVVGEDVRAAADELLAEVTDEQRAAWTASGPVAWANESFATAIRPEVQYCVRTEGGCWYEASNESLDEGEPERTVVVDQSYIETKAPVVREQLVKAGVRLAALVNQALGR